MTTEDPVIGTDAAGIIVLDQAGRILLKNPRAETLLGTGGPLQERHNRLSSPLASVDKRLRAIIDQKANVGPAPHLFYLPRNKRPPLLAMLFPLPVNVTHDLGALLLFWDPQAVRVLPAAALTQLFGLTPTEALVALATYDGQSPIVETGNDS